MFTLTVDSLLDKYRSSDPVLSQYDRDDLAWLVQSELEFRDLYVDTLTDDGSRYVDDVFDFTEFKYLCTAFNL